MAHYPRRSWPARLWLLPLTGCANFAVPPQTPARQIDFSGLREPPHGERFYVLVFGSESTPRVPRFTHSWATFVRVTDSGGGGEPTVEARTISWMPATLNTRLGSFRIEPGVNLDLHETIRYALDTGERVVQWGPHECRPELYYRAVVQKGFLEGGGMGYQCVDTVGEAGRTGRGCNCIHGITDTDPQYTRSRYRLIRFGIAASRFIAHELARRDMLINPNQRSRLAESSPGSRRLPDRAPTRLGMVVGRMKRTDRADSGRVGLWGDPTAVTGVQAGGALAGKDSSEASSTMSLAGSDSGCPR